MNTVSRWKTIRSRLEDPNIDRVLMDVWLRNRDRAFAIETGQVEDLYRLKRGVTEQLIAEGFEGVRGAHSSIGELSDETLRGLLDDQEFTLQAVFDLAVHRTELGHHQMKELHQKLTEHQKDATGIHGITGKRIRIPLIRGNYKIRPNNPRRLDGFVHEYCPPEQVRSELDRLFELHRGIAARNLPTEVEAAWLHHEFVRIHPFQDGNGRMSRLLVAYVFTRNGEFPPVVQAARKGEYIDMLETADEGDLRPFVRYLADLSEDQTRSALRSAESVLRGRNRLRHGNGGVTRDRKYYPPDPGDTDFDLPDDDLPDEALEVPPKSSLPDPDDD